MQIFLISMIVFALWCIFESQLHYWLYLMKLKYQNWKSRRFVEELKKEINDYKNEL